MFNIKLEIESISSFFMKACFKNDERRIFTLPVEV